MVICAFISPFEAERRSVRELMPDGTFFEVFVDTPLAESRRRDTKGLYVRAESGAIKNFTGIDSPYEPPENPPLVLKTEGRGPEAAAEELISALEAAGLI